jgi:hypothetical protein
VTISNLGFIRWNSRTSYVRADTAFEFTGADVSDLFDFTNTIKGSYSIDSALVQPYLKDRTRKSITSLMPGRFMVSYTGSFSPHYFFTLRADHFWMANYLPSLMFSPGYRIHHHELMLTTRFGGYGKFFAGLAWHFDAHGWDIALRSEYLSGMLMSDGKGQGASLLIAKSF